MRKRINNFKDLIVLAIIAVVLIIIFIVKTVTVFAEDVPNINIYGEPVEFQATAYCHTGNPTKSGVYPLEGRTVAVDPKVIPLGSTVIVYTEDMVLFGIYQAEDTGRLIKGNIIDIYMENEADCWEWGRQKVFIQVIDAKG